MFGDCFCIAYAVINIGNIYIYLKILFKDHIIIEKKNKNFYFNSTDYLSLTIDVQILNYILVVELVFHLS